MKFTRTEIPDIIICEPEVHGDSRGYFMESFRCDRLETFIGRSVNFCQDNESRSSRGVLRGLHYQFLPHAQTKLVRVIEGRVLDVSLDIRKGSPTFGKYVALELSGENKKQVFIPRGFAHGFVVLSDTALFSYKTDAYYHPESERGIAFNDPALAIDWKLPESELKLSAKDREQPLFEKAEFFDFNTGLYG